LHFFKKFISFHRGAELLQFFKVIAEKERQYLQIVSDILFEFFEGNIQKDQLKTIAFILFGTCNGIYHWYDPRGSITPQKLSEIISDILCGGLRGYEKKRKVNPVRKNRALTPALSKRY
ncbi:MAG: hypothetical protein QME90_17220, partial [Thermodesulfobacteriota bacterium]|nr:hypothetical protein [Thermodesulfobacteriota bacterium]